MLPTLGGFLFYEHFLKSNCSAVTVAVLKEFHGTWHAPSALRPCNPQLLQPTRVELLQHIFEGYKLHLQESLTLTALAMDAKGTKEDISEIE